MRDLIRIALETALRKGAIKEAIAVMQEWLLTAKPGAPEQMLASCSDAIRPKMALMMRDLLARFPNTLLGCPVLIYAEPASLDELTPRNLILPLADPHKTQPCADLEFLGWISKDLNLPLPQPFSPQLHQVTVDWKKPTAAIALFQSQPDVYDLDEIELPSQWWGELFLPVDATIRITARMLVPYPDAIEAAEVMQAATRREALPSKRYFLTDNAWSWATNEGVLFLDSCRHQFPSMP